MYSYYFLYYLLGSERPKRTRTTSKHGSGTAMRQSKSSSRLPTSKVQQARTLPPLTESSEQGTTATTGSPKQMIRQQTVPTVRTSAVSGRLPGKGSALRHKSLSISLKSEDESGDKMASLLRSLFRLWCHESSRVFTDRLTQSKDKIWFAKLLDVTIKYCYCGATISDAGEEGGGGGGGRRRTRPGRPSKVSQTPSSTALGLVIQSSDLDAASIDLSLLQLLLPKDVQHQFLTFDQVAMRGEDLSSLIFSCLPPERGLEGEEGEDGNSGKGLGRYVEVGDGQLRVLLADIIMDKSNGLTHILVNKDVIEHVTRLTRALVRYTTG